jgi:hypothetical protein
MTDDSDNYEAYYADKLWSMLPAVYRAQDTDNFSTNGPLREMVNRIGAQAAILRRSIDRTWEDQSIETCDDWVIPYIGDLVATNLVANLDSRGQRLDVAKTIYYRRRKGTVGILEQIAYDITGWNAKVVEFFRRMGRTRHGLDPEIGVAPALQLAEGLIGPLTSTRIGGFANLRNVDGASKAHTAFDEFYYTADFRLGQGQIGWYNIPRLGVFLWRLQSFGVPPTTPVPVAGCQGWFTFDPTGRDIPLFAQASRTTEYYGDNWVAPTEAQLPTPISQPLLDADEKLPSSTTTPPILRLYPNSLSVLDTPKPGPKGDVIPGTLLKIRPARGRFEYLVSPPRGSPPAGLWVQYFYGFSSAIGAGPYDRRPGLTPAPTPGRLVSLSGGVPLRGPNAPPSSGTLQLGDSLTYSGVDNVTVNGQLTLLSENEQRPLIRFPRDKHGNPPSWTLKGETGSSLVLDGLFISGGDIFLTGDFNSVTLTCCTLDPGSAPSASPAGSPPGGFPLAADAQELVPTLLWIAGTIGTLTIQRSIVGPILTTGQGTVETLSISDSIIQAISNSTPHLHTLQPETSPPGAASQALPADTALDVADADVSLSRCTVMGAINAHWLDASECILQDIATVDDIQQGCVRFTAWASGSVIPRKYESVQIPARAPLFTSTDFGQPGYGQLLQTADDAILPGTTVAGAPQNTISAGAEDGSEMGAFAREQNPIKERSLLIKYQEFMPVGLVPVVIYVT